jgi:hypothetical protein
MLVFKLLLTFFKAQSSIRYLCLCYFTNFCGYKGSFTIQDFSGAFLPLLNFENFSLLIQKQCQIIKKAISKLPNNATQLVYLLNRQADRPCQIVWASWVHNQLTGLGCLFWRGREKKISILFLFNVYGIFFNRSLWCLVQ